MEEFKFRTSEEAHVSAHHDQIEHRFAEDKF